MNYLMIAAGMACSAGAQVMLKFASRFTLMSVSWIAAMGGSIALYGASFILYALILKHGALSRVSPAMTIGVAALVILSGIFLFGERLSTRQIAGIVLGVSAVYLLLSR